MLWTSSIIINLRYILSRRRGGSGGAIAVPTVHSLRHKYLESSLTRNGSIRRRRRSYPAHLLILSIVSFGLGVFLLQDDFDSPSLLLLTENDVGVVHGAERASSSAPGVLRTSRRDNDDLSLTFRRHRLPWQIQSMKFPTIADTTARGKPRYNGIVIFETTPEKDRQKMEKERSAQLAQMDQEQSINRRWRAVDDDYSDIPHCQRVNWKYDIKPVCNNFHDQPFMRGLENGLPDYSLKMLGRGSYRTAYRFQPRRRPLHYANNSTDTAPRVPFVLKVSRYVDGLDFDIKTFARIHTEAILMERLTSSPRILNMFGLCGASIYNEYMTTEVTSLIEVSRYAKLANGSYVYEAPSLSHGEKLRFAISMAESIADLHGFEGGTVVHGDIDPKQWLIGPDGQMKLNDFNYGKILEFNTTSQQYCKMRQMAKLRSYRAPEEHLGVNSNEKIDVYSMGYNLFSIMTGYYPFYDLPEKERNRQLRLVRDPEVQLKPHIPERFRQHFVDRGLIHIMQQCWAYNMDQRVSIFDVIRQLRALRDTYQAQRRTKALHKMTLVHGAKNP